MYEICATEIQTEKVVGNLMVVELYSFHDRFCYFQDYKKLLLHENDHSNVRNYDRHEK